MDVTPETSPLHQHWWNPLSTSIWQKAKLELKDESERNRVFFLRWVLLLHPLDGENGDYTAELPSFPFSLNHSRAWLVNLYWHSWTNSLHIVAVWLAYHLLRYRVPMSCWTGEYFVIISHFGLFPLILCELDHQTQAPCVGIFRFGCFEFPPFTGWCFA